MQWLQAAPQFMHDQLTQGMLQVSGIFESMTREGVVDHCNQDTKLCRSRPTIEESQ